MEEKIRERVIYHAIELLRKESPLFFSDMKLHLINHMTNEYEHTYKKERDRKAADLDLFRLLCEYCEKEGAEITMSATGKSYDSYVFAHTQSIIDFF